MSSQARAKAREYMNRAKDRFNMSESQVKDLMNKAGIKNLDSSNDIRQMNAEYQASQNNRPNQNNQANQNSRPQGTMGDPIIGQIVGTSGLSTGNIRGIADELGIVSIDSQNDINQIQAVIDSRNEDNIIASEPYTTLVDDYNTLSDDYTNVTNELTNYGSQISGYEDQIRGFQDQIGGYETQIGQYKTDFDELTGRYEGAISERDDYMQRFSEQSDLYEQARAEADTYREQAVGRQLSGLRGGATSGGANQSSYGTSGSLASGRSGYSSSTRNREKGLADYVVEKGGLTDSVLKREGPVVEQLQGRDSSAAPSGGQRRGQTPSAGTGSYYASRFGR